MQLILELKNAIKKIDESAVNNVEEDTPYS